MKYNAQRDQQINSHVWQLAVMEHDLEKALTKVIVLGPDLT